MSHTPSGFGQRFVNWAAVSTRQQADDDRESIPVQIADGKAFVERLGGRLVNTLIVPGHSRRYIDFHALRDDARAAGIEAFAQLEGHWKARDFDVLIIRDGDRFARTQALHAYITEQVIDAGARLYSFADGWIDQANYRIWTAMCGYRAAGAIDQLQKYYQMGVNARPKRGLPAGSRVLWSHLFVRDAVGRAQRVEVDESKRPIFDDLAALILEGVSWFELEQALYDRFGHVHENGKPFPHNFFYKRVHNPQWWGHVARHHNNEAKGRQWDLWVFDESAPVPDHVTVFRDVFPAVWPGALGEQVRAELTRRRHAIRGRARAHQTRQFSGIFVCDECGCALKYAFDHRKWIGLKCDSRYWATENPCTQKRAINEPAAKVFIDSFLRGALEADDLSDVLQEPDAGTPDIARRAESLRAELVQADVQARRLMQLIIRQADNTALQATFEDELRAIGERTAILRAAIAEADRQAGLAGVRPEQNQALLRLRAVVRAGGLDAFWALPQKEINQYLHAVMGRWRFAVRDREVVGLTPVKYPQRKQR